MKPKRLLYPSIFLRCLLFFAWTTAIAGIGRMVAQAPNRAVSSPSETGQGWPTYGGDPGGLRFSQSSEITKANLDRLHPVWTFHTHALEGYDPKVWGLVPSFEATPVLSGTTLYLPSPYNVVFALDARTGT